MAGRGVAEWARALGLIPSGLYAMTSAYGGERSGVLVSWVQQCGFEPPMVAIASPKGRSIAPLIRDSRAFALNLLRPDDTFLLRILSRDDLEPCEVLDPVRCESLVTGSPCITRAIAALDCEVVRHIDLEGDHEMYIGQVMGGRLYDDAATPGRLAAFNGTAH